VAATSQQKINCPLRWPGQGHATHFLSLWTPTISRTGEGRHFIFGTWMDRGSY